MRKINLNETTKETLKVNNSKKLNVVGLLRATMEDCKNVKNKDY